MHWRDRRSRPGRIELLNGRWHMPRPAAFRRCAGCGRQVPDDARIVYLNGEAFHSHCAHHDGGLL